ncbi:MAG: hypothetical protein BYD32DRAFT_436526 [Podila humilis]|nr:MAG: hypothetical protein BYD32DRAFT_436526 [Podila humilis]
MLFASILSFPSAILVLTLLFTIASDVRAECWSTGAGITHAYACNGEKVEDCSVKQNDACASALKESDKGLRKFYFSCCDINKRKPENPGLKKLLDILAPFRPTDSCVHCHANGEESCYSKSRNAKFPILGQAASDLCKADGNVGVVCDYGPYTGNSVRCRNFAPTIAHYSG